MDRYSFKKIIIKVLIITIIFNFGLSSTNINKILFNNDNVAFASQADRIESDDSVYNEESEYLQYCLNKLGYRDYDNRVLDTDGYFGEKSKSALNKFLKVENFVNFNTVSKNKLISLAESTVKNTTLVYSKLDDNKLLATAFIYSSVSNINNTKDPFYSMRMLINFPFIITMKPDEMSYKSKRVANFIKSNTKIFGYVNLGPDNPTANKSMWRQADLDKVKAEVDSIANAGWHGVFIDQFGYDWNETRERQNIIVDYIHNKGLKVMVNSWFVDDALASKFHQIANSKETPTHLNNDDWYLIESFFTDGDSYRGDSSYIEKYLKVKEYKDSKKINVATLSYKRNITTWEEAEADIKASYILAKSLGFDGWWFGKTDNSDELLYGSAPNLNLGNFIYNLKHESGNKYVAETENYKIEYYSESIPILKLIAKVK